MIAPGVPAEPDIHRLAAAVEGLAVVAFLERTWRRNVSPPHPCHVGGRRPSFFSAGTALAGRFTHASNASQSLAGIVTMLRSSTSISAASSALRRTKSL